MHWKTGLIFIVLVGILAMDMVSCEDDKSKDSSEDNSDSSEEEMEAYHRFVLKDAPAIRREKRSDEEIMFGNQQNKANGAVNDFLMGIDAKDGDKKAEKKTNESDKEAGQSTDTENAKQECKECKEVIEKENTVEVKKASPDERLGDVMSEDASSEMVSSPRWLGNDAPAEPSPDALQYIFNSRPMQAMGPANNFVDVSGVFDQSDLYRRKRQSIVSSNRPVSLMKRSLRSPIGQMIRTRRLPRRSMRLKRQVDVEQILSMIRNAESNYGGSESGFYKPASEKYGSGAGTVFRHRNLPYENLAGPNGADMENSQKDNDVDDSMESNDLAEALLYPPPSSRYFGIPDYPVQNKANEQDGGEVLPRWMEAPADRISPPSIFTVARRSFYPIDYRYVPGYKKRSNLNGEDDDDVPPPMNFGKWGRVVDVPGAYASAEDVARLYALANLLAENDNAGIRARRSA